MPGATAIAGQRIMGRKVRTGIADSVSKYITGLPMGPASIHGAWPFWANSVALPVPDKRNELPHQTSLGDIDVKPDEMNN